ncbi:TadE/TadG family type IV pilus assembly protein [Microvirga massiliensis]|uniref:TadE/TadG family type IV pilus assembly protein n=1 Tax=Microvirga massiliensis TaxID=1033741 RepID=UPI00062B90EC|nr:TadE family protein [Microvirga massiliensis]
MLKRFRRNEDGAALVEATLVMPILVILMLGGIELGLGISAHHQIDKSVRDAARYFARLPADYLTANLTNAWVTARIKGDDKPTPCDMLGTFDPKKSSGKACPWDTADGRKGIFAGLSPTVTATVDTARLADGFVRIQASITYKPLIASKILTDGFTFNVRHEQPLIGG